jgi:hypothetical protein
MMKHLFWVVVSSAAVAILGFALGACGSDKTGSSGSALTDCDAGDACAPAQSQGGW